MWGLSCVEKPFQTEQEEARVHLSCSLNLHSHIFNSINVFYICKTTVWLVLSEFQLITIREGTPRVHGVCDCDSLCGTGTSWAAWTGCGSPTGVKGRTSSVLPERWMASCTSSSVSPETNTATLVKHWWLHGDGKLQARHKFKVQIRKEFIQFSLFSKHIFISEFGEPTESSGLRGFHLRKMR